MMIFTSINRILLITTLCFSALVNAQQVANTYTRPYQGNVLVGSFDEAQLKEQALQQVLVKVSGNLEITNRDEAKLLLKKVQLLISQYGYRNIQGGKYFSALFDKNKINQALQEMQQPVWGDTRPTTLIWLINKNNLVSDNAIKQQDDLYLSLAVQQTEQQRGIHVQFPLMDLDDNIALSVSDIKGHFYEQVERASARYQQAYFVVADLQQISTERWKLSWQLLPFDNTAKRTDPLLNEVFIGDKASVTINMINTLADYYASQYAIVENQGDKFTQTIHIDGINSLGQLAQLNSILGNMLAISAYNIVQADGEKVIIKVKLTGGLNSFKNTLLVEPHLQLTSKSTPLVALIPANSVLPGNNSQLLVTEALYFNWR